MHDASRDNIAIYSRSRPFVCSVVDGQTFLWRGQGPAKPLEWPRSAKRSVRTVRTSTVVDLHARFFFRFFLLMSKKGVPSLPSRGRVNLCLPVHVAYSTLRVVVGAAERSESSESSRLSGALWSSLFGKFSSAPCDAFAPLHLSLAR